MNGWYIAAIVLFVITVVLVVAALICSIIVAVQAGPVAAGLIGWAATKAWLAYYKTTSLGIATMALSGAATVPAFATWVCYAVGKCSKS